MKRASLFCLIAVALHAQVYRASSNFTADLYGSADTRPGTWGYADVAQWHITFQPPAGWAVKVYDIRGDLVSWIKSLPGDAPTPLESAAGVLLGLQSTPHANSGRCDLCADMARKLALLRLPVAPVAGTTMVYVQDDLAQAAPKSRAAYTAEHVDQILDTDNQLLVTVASWLNTTGKPIHIEPTFTVTYSWVPIHPLQ